MFWIARVESIITIISSLGIIFGIIIPLARRAFLHHYKTKYMEEVLFSKNKKIFVTFPFYQRKVEPHNTPYDMVTEEEVKCIKALTDFCNMVNTSVYFQDEYRLAADRG